MAQRWYEGLEEVLLALAEMPRRFAYARENDTFSELELRQVVYQSHRLIFTIKDEQVIILHVRHIAQQPLDEL